MKGIKPSAIYPPGLLLNPATRYTPAVATDLRARFARERKALGLPTPKRAPQPARRAIERARRTGTAWPLPAAGVV